MNGTNCLRSLTNLAAYRSRSGISVSSRRIKLSSGSGAGNNSPCGTLLTDAGSNALFGSLQVITANKLGLSPILMGAANSAGGVIGKMIAAQSLVIACAATGQDGKEGLLVRPVVKHSIVLALIVGLLVPMYAYVFPGAIPNGHHYW